MPGPRFTIRRLAEAFRSRVVMSMIGISDLETLGGFPRLPAFWLRRAKPGYVTATRTHVSQDAQSPRI
jgi:hypothetical protein